MISYIVPDIMTLNLGRKATHFFLFFARVDVYTCNSVNRHYTTQNIVLHLC